MEIQYITGKKIHDTVKLANNVAEYVVARLVDLGIEHSFSIPGDFVFAVLHALENNPKNTNIGNANELNASYAADCYARIKGAAILSTTYGVGELSALNGVMGAKAENNIIFHIVGAPEAEVVHNRKSIHHSLGDGVFDNFFNIGAKSSCVSAIINPDNAVREMNRVIREAFKYRQPAYIVVARDVAKLPVIDKSVEDNHCDEILSVPALLKKAAEIASDRIIQSKKIVVLPSLKLEKYGLTKQAIQLIEKLNAPFAIMPQHKSVISVDHKNYIGIYAGINSSAGIKEIVENADLVIDLGGTMWSDMNTGNYSTNICSSKLLTLDPLFIKDKHNFVNNIFLGDLLKIINQSKEIKTSENNIIHKENTVFASSSNNMQTAFYNALFEYVHKEDILIGDAGSILSNILPASIPQRLYTQTLWGSIGWGLPAALGACLAAPHQKVILLIGDGAHQLTLNDIGAMGRYGLSPIIICVNNKGFLCERALDEFPDSAYNDVAQINYTLLPEAFGCNNWLTLKIEKISELKEALLKARAYNGGVYIEVEQDKYDYGVLSSLQKV